MASKYKYKFTAKAKQDLDDILNYIIKNLKSPEAAKNLLGKLFAAIEEARTFPLSGILVENELIAYNNIRRKIVDNYVVYYLTDSESKTLYILRIVYAKRNLDEILISLGRII